MLSSSIIRKPPSGSPLLMPRRHQRRGRRRTGGSWENIGRNERRLLRQRRLKQDSGGQRAGELHRGRDRCHWGEHREGPAMVTSLWVKSRGTSTTGLRSTWRYSTSWAAQWKREFNNNWKRLFAHIVQVLDRESWVYLLDRRLRREEWWAADCNPDFQTREQRHRERVQQQEKERKSGAFFGMDLKKICLAISVFQIGFFYYEH